MSPAQRAVAALQNSTFWPGLLRLEPGLEAREEGDWHLASGESQAVVKGDLVSGRWAVNRTQALLQLMLGTILAGLGLYSLAYAAKLPVLVAVVNLPQPAVLLVLLYLLVWAAYLLDHLGKSLMGALQTVHDGFQTLPDSGAWRETLRPIAVAQSIYILDAFFGAYQRHQITGPLLFGLAAQIILVAGCCHLSPRHGWRDVVVWCAAWSLILVDVRLFVYLALPAVVLVTTPRMLRELKNGLTLNVNTETLTEKLFWLCFLLMVCVSFGALLGHTLFWGLHPRALGDDPGKPWWVGGATVATILALFIAPLGAVRIPLFLASTLYQALLAKFGALAALLGAIAVILARSLWLHPRQPLVALRHSLTFGLAESTGRMLGACLGLFFLGLEGGAVGGALGERALGALVLLRQEEAEP